MDYNAELEKMVHALYNDPAVEETVIADAIEHGTVADIVNGKCTLPHPDDALRHHLRITGQASQTPTEREQGQLISSLESRLKDLESKFAPAPAPTPKPEG